MKKICKNSSPPEGVVFLNFKTARTQLSDPQTLPTLIKPEAMAALLKNEENPQCFAEAVDYPVKGTGGAYYWQDAADTESGSRQREGGVVMGVLWDDGYDGIVQLIDINPVKITWDRYPMKDNGYGEQIPDTKAVSQRKEALVRLSRQKGGVQNTAVASTGPTTNLSMYVLALYDADLQIGDIISANAGVIQKWEAGVVDKLFVEGECYAKQATLVRADG